MKLVILVITILLLVPSVLYAEEEWEDMGEIIQPVESKGPDFRQMRLEGLNWKARYLNCLIVNIENAYKAKSYQDKRYIETRRQLEEVTKEIRALTLGAPNINNPKKEEAK